MNNILIQTPSDLPNVWRTCPIVKADISHPKNSASVTVKGVAVHENATTLIIINDLKAFKDNEVVNSLYGYFKIKITEESKLLFNHEEENYR